MKKRIYSLVEKLNNNNPDKSQAEDTPLLQKHHQ